MDCLISTCFIDKNGDKFIFHLSNGDEVLTVMNINSTDEELRNETSKLMDSWSATGNRFFLECGAFPC